MPDVTNERLAILAVFDAKPGKEQDVEAFLQSALPMVQAEDGTIRWYALKLGGSTYGIFDTFADRQGRDAHLAGAIAKALIAGAEELFQSPPTIGKTEILAVK
jgi:quinol monooxygenase YgiN